MREMITRLSNPMQRRRSRDWRVARRLLVLDGLPRCKAIEMFGMDPQTPRD
ncbi:MAG: hypothetical protein ACJ8AW_35535 [Rhodopila sp.]